MDLLANFVQKYRQNRRMLLGIVYVALFLDNMLLTTVVPIIPEYLLRIQHPNNTEMLLHDRFDDLPPASSESAESEGSRRKRQFEWDSADWDRQELGEEEERGEEQRRRKMKSKGGRKGAKQRGGGMRGGGIRTTTMGLDGDDYEALPDELTIGFQGGPEDANFYVRPMPQSRKKNRTMSNRERIRAERERERHEILAEENIHVGLMFGSKALVQVIANPMIGPLTNKIGYTLPMFAGFAIMFLSTLLFAFGGSFGTLWMARALQGIGSACTSTSGMGMLAQAYPDDAERGSAMGIALGGLALGVLVGPPYGGLLYEWAGKELPFILLAILALMDGTLQFMLLQPKVDRGEPEGTAIMELAKDPYIVVAAGSITIGNLGIAMLEPSLPLWMMESWSATSFERGAAFLPASISYLIGTNIFGPLAHKIGRWLSSFIGLVVIGFCLIAIPSANSVYGLIVPNFCMGFSIGMIDASMFPMMGYIVDVRHVGVYGSIYAIADAAFCFAFFLGPFFSGPLVRTVGFPTMMYLIAVINFIYAPLMFFLRLVPSRQQEQVPLTPGGGTLGGVSRPSIQIDSAPSNALLHHQKAQQSTVYEKIEGITDPQLLTGHHQNGYNLNSVWED